eukprot:GHVR01008410.1.p1 GENE.GHVR01008410.1~~GHVR01008410.1.p1  ORF type:complete len:134 (+),score=11.77 GHVR01008410.1:745-1146(+)
MSQEELRTELLKRRRNSSPVSSTKTQGTPAQSPEILLQMAMLNDNVSKMMSQNIQNERISVARLNVDPHSLVCQVGGGMTLGFLSTLIEPIMAMNHGSRGWSTPIMAMNHGSRGLVHTNNGDESWIEGTGPHQ